MVKRLILSLNSERMQFFHNARHFLSGVAKGKRREKRSYHQRICCRYDFNRGVFNCVLNSFGLSLKTRRIFLVAYIFSVIFIMIHHNKDMEGE